MLAKDLVIEDGVVTTPKTDILDSLYLMLKHRRRILPVLTGSKLVGIVSVASYIPAIQSMDSRKPETILVGEILNEQPFVASPNTEASYVADCLCAKGVYGVPVVSGHEYMGMIRREDVISRFLVLIKGKFKAMDVMSYNVSTCSIHETLEHLVKRISAGIERRVVVMNVDKIEGSITFEDLINVILADKSDISKLSVSDVLVPIQASVKKTDDAAKAAQFMLDWGINAIPVVDGGGLEGIIRDKDILQRIQVLM